VPYTSERLFRPVPFGAPANDSPHASDTSGDSAKNCFTAPTACRSAGDRSPSSDAACQLRLVASPPFIVVEPTSSTYQGSGNSTLASAPSPRLASAPNTRPTANGWSTKLHVWGWVLLIRPNRVRNWPARICTRAGSARVVAYASSISTPNNVNTRLLSKRRYGSTDSASDISTCCRLNPSTVGSWPPVCSGASDVNTAPATSRMTDMSGFIDWNWRFWPEPPEAAGGGGGAAAWAAAASAASAASKAASSSGVSSGVSGSAGAGSGGIGAGGGAAGSAAGGPSGAGAGSPGAAHAAPAAFNSITVANTTQP
jgi:hypothetical protein